MISSSVRSVKPFTELIPPPTRKQSSFFLSLKVKDQDLRPHKVSRPLALPRLTTFLWHHSFGLLMHFNESALWADCHAECFQTYLRKEPKSQITITIPSTDHPLFKEINCDKSNQSSFSWCLRSTEQKITQHPVGPESARDTTTVLWQGHKWWLCVQNDSQSI